jgi:hypothetical protein
MDLPKEQDDNSKDDDKSSIMVFFSNTTINLEIKTAHHILLDKWIFLLQ